MLVVTSEQSLIFAAEKPPKLGPEHRTCVVCGCRLSRYNRSDLYCALDEGEARAKRLLKASRR